MSPQHKANGDSARRTLLAWCLGAGLFALAALVVVFSRLESSTIKRGEMGRVSDVTGFAAYAKSATCQSCHEESFQLWETSHHALAERAVSSALDSRAFEPAAKISHGSQGSEARVRNQHFEVSTIGANGQLQPGAGQRGLRPERGRPLTDLPAQRRQHRERDRFTHPCLRRSGNECGGGVFPGRAVSARRR